MNLQLWWDLYRAQCAKARQLEKIKPDKLSARSAGEVKPRLDVSNIHLTILAIIGTAHSTPTIINSPTLPPNNLSRSNHQPWTGFQLLRAKSG